MSGRLGLTGSAGGNGERRCAGCSAALTSDNSSRLCGRCHREQRDQFRTPPAGLPDDFWRTDDFLAAFESQHIGRVFKVYRNHPHHIRVFGKALNQELLGRWLGLTQAQISKIENGRRPEYNLETLRHYCKVLMIPQEFLWFDMPGQSRLTRVQPSPRSSSIAVVESGLVTPQGAWQDLSDIASSFILDEDNLLPSVSPLTLASTIRETVADLMAIDLKRGGGHTRRLLSRYFQDEVAPLLSWRFPDEALRNDVLGAGAETLQLLGWSAYDAGSHDAARRYFNQALRLARHTNDLVMAGRIFSNLSHQANFLGRFDEALHYARDAVTISAGTLSNTARAMFVAMEARALASLGDAPGTVRALQRAERLFESRNPENDPPWVSYFDKFELASEAAHCFRDLGLAAECRRYAQASMDPDHTPARTLAFMRMVGASGTLAGGDVDQAVELAREAIHAGLSVQSARYVKYLRDFYSSLAAKDARSSQDIRDLLSAHYPTLVIL
ncbi:hypothetical protein [Actinoalloteichus caeruleus]|uniref:hypothetical protein n=1 Tax=Actinoalloteichus cyanogriseus TaxID=2893586 RepID=UPI003AAD9D32